MEESNICLAINLHSITFATLLVREVVQPGRIPGLGPGGRRFESCPPDFYISQLISNPC